MNTRSLLAGIGLLLPFGLLLPGCGGGSSGFTTATPSPTLTASPTVTASSSPTATSTATASPTATTSPTTSPTVTASPSPTATSTATGQFNLSVANSSDSNYGLTSFQTSNISSATQRQSNGFYFVTLMAQAPAPNGTTDEVTIRLNKSGPFAVGDSFVLGTFPTKSFTIESSRSTSDPARPFIFTGNSGTGTATVTAATPTSIALQLSNVQAQAALYGATGSVTFNGTVQAALPPA